MTREADIYETVRREIDVEQIEDNVSSEKDPDEELHEIQEDILVRSNSVDHSVDHKEQSNDSQVKHFTTVTIVV